MKNKNLLKWISAGLFILVALANYLSAMGIIFPHTQAEVSDKYVNLLAPAGFTFSIWGVIYLGVILSLLIGFMRSRDDKFQRNYRTKILPLFIAWMILNIVWIVSWSYELILLSFIAIFLYALILLQLVKVIHESPVLEKHRWLLTYPVGLHAGWLVVATFANITTLLVKWDFNAIGTVGIIWTLGVIAVILAIVTTIYLKTRNDAIMIPTLWALIGVIVKHAPNSSFQYANNIVFFAAIVLLVIGAGIYVNFLRKFHFEKA